MPAPLVEVGIFALAISLAFVAQRSARLFIMPALLIGGVALGPGGVDVLRDVAFVENANSVGLVLLLFFTSLFAHPKALRLGGRVALPLAAYDLVLNFAAAYWIGSLLGWDLESRLFLAGVMATSSTGAILKILSDEGRLLHREGNVLVALLWIEDLAFIGYYMFLSRKQHLGGWAATELVVGLAGFAAYLLVLRMVRERVWAVRRLEILVPLVTGLGLIATWLGSLGGLPYVGSAFAAGLVLSGSRGGRFIQVEAPFLREGASAVFFLSFGAMLDPHVTWNVLPLAAAALVGIVVTELFFLPAAARLLGLTGPESLILGSSLLARGGKSAAFAQLGTDSKATSPAINSQIQSVAGLLTILLTPAAPLLVRLALWLRRGSRAARSTSHDVLSRITRRALAPTDYGQRHLASAWSRVELGLWIALEASLILPAVLVPWPWRLVPVGLGLVLLAPAFRNAQRYFHRSPGNPSMGFESRRKGGPALEDYLPMLLFGPLIMAYAFALTAPWAAPSFPIVAASGLLALLLMPRLVSPVVRAPSLGRVLPT